MRAGAKKDYPLDRIRRRLETGPIVLVSSAWKGKTNIMTMGWHMMMQFSPALFGCYIWDGNHSFDMIRKAREMRDLYSHGRPRKRAAADASLSRAG